MINLFLSITATSLLFIIFKIFEKFKIVVLHGIVVNYLVAFAFGWIFRSTENTPDLTSVSWLFHAVLLGCMFISLFNLIGFSSQKIGVSITSVIIKMSMVIPISFAIIFFRENINLLKIIGILLALVSVYLTNKKINKTSAKKNFILPLILFIGSGLLDTMINFSQKTVVPSSETDIFISIIFFVAFFLGFIYSIIRIIKKQDQFRWNAIPGGIILGLVNYASLYFFIEALRAPELVTSVTFAINNVGIVLFSALAGVLLFREKLNKYNWAGIALAIVSIILITIF